MHEDLSKIANKYNINCFGMWNIEGGNGWIWHRQRNEKEYEIQIKTNDNFERYRQIKSDIIDFFSNLGYSLSNESDLTPNFGFRRNLIFIETNELQKIKAGREKEREEFLKQINTSTFNVGYINAPNGIVTLGNVIDSTQSIDNSFTNIGKLIEEKGGEDKEELISLKNELKTIVDEMIKTKQISPKKGFIDKLGNHLSKHGWFYGAIVQVLGAASMSIMSGANK